MRDGWCARADRASLAGLRDARIARADASMTPMPPTSSKYAPGPELVEPLRPHAPPEDAAPSGAADAHAADAGVAGVGEVNIGRIICRRRLRDASPTLTASASTPTE
eukprot:859431-Prymnesium_polylepis.1